MGLFIPSDWEFIARELYGQEKIKHVDLATLLDTFKDIRTGNNNIIQLSKHFFSFKNTSIYVWYKATKKRAKLWEKNKHLLNYTSKHKLKYKTEIVMNGFAQLEIITK